MKRKREREGDAQVKTENSGMKRNEITKGKDNMYREDSRGVKFQMFK